MNAQPYENLSDLDLLSLVVWREAQNQQFVGMFAVAYSIKNRVDHPGWWGHDWKTVILKPWQYTSMHPSDPNATKWPADKDFSFCTAGIASAEAYHGTHPDTTNGATHYYDTSIPFPYKSWGDESGWINTFNTGRLRFWKVKP